MSRILVKAEDIRQWVEARGGYPVMMDVPDGTRSRTLLQLTFGQHFLNADENEGPDRPYGYELVSWDEWLAELEKQNLALQVSDDPSGGNEQEYRIIGHHDDRNTA